MATPAFFQPSSSEIKTYSIHLMWINETRKEAQPYISTEETEEAMNTRLLRPALEWAKSNHEATVSIWYDSAFTSPTAIENTQMVLTRLMHEQNLSNIQLRDIHEIPIVQQNPDTFTDQIPVYFRVDLLKCIILVDAIERGHQDSAIFSDLEVGDARPAKDRMSKEELFTQSIIELMKKHGIILNKNGPRTENQFIQLFNHKQMLEALKFIVINMGLKRIEYVLNTLDPRYLNQYTESVYLTMLQQLPSYFSAISNHQPITIINTKNYEETPYFFEEHGYDPLGYVVNPAGSIGETISFEKTRCAVSRDVDVSRGGNSHRDYPYIPRPPANGKTYSCTLMELDPSFLPTKENSSKLAP